MVKVDQFNIKAINDLLDSGEVVEVALEKGPKVVEAIKLGKMKLFNANVKVIKEGENLGTCGCGKTANVIINLSR